MSSRLFQRVREELGLAYAVYTFQSFHADSGMHGVYVATAPESASAALDAIRDELQPVVDDGLPADEVAMGRQQLKGQVTLSLESVSSRMYRAASVELYDEPYRTLDEVLALIDAITVEDVARVARAFFDPERHDGRQSRPERDRLTRDSVDLGSYSNAASAGHCPLRHSDDEDRRSKRDQNQREPHRARSGRRGGARRRRAIRCSIETGGGLGSGFADDACTRPSARRSRPTPRPCGATAR